MRPRNPRIAVFFCVFRQLTGLQGPNANRPQAHRVSMRRTMLSRRSFACIATPALPRLLRAIPTSFSGLSAAFRGLEKTNGGRLGVAVAVVDTATGERSGYRADERFPMCSTFKFLLVSAVLQRVDHHHETLERATPIPPKPLP